MAEIRELADALIRALGEDPTREGLRRTPVRFEAAMRHLTQGYRQTAEEIVGDAIYQQPYDQMILVKDIDFYSLCEHHLLPFYGKAHVAYIPDGRVIGLSKIPRIVELYARRLQLQERLTKQIAETLRDAVRPLGVGVVIEAYHLCVAMRGVEKQNAFMTTSEVLGDFRSDRATRSEFLQLLSKRPSR